MRVVPIVSVSGFGKCPATSRTIRHWEFSQSGLKTLQPKSESNVALNPTHYAMADIIRTAATAEITEKTRKATFDAATYYFNPNVEMTIVGCKVVTHQVDGVQKNNGVPVLALKHGEEEVIVYLRSFLKVRRDYKDDIVNVKGSLNDLVLSYRGKTIGELIDALNALSGRKVKTTLTVYRGINKNGEVQDIFVNGYDLMPE
jgi:hypothetical protein